VSAKSKGRSRLAIRYFDDRVLLTDMHAWAYYRVPSVSYEFTTPDEREAFLQLQNGAFVQTQNTTRYYMSVSYRISFQ